MSDGIVCRNLDLRKAQRYKFPHFYVGIWCPRAPWPHYRKPSLPRAWPRQSSSSATRSASLMQPAAAGATLATGLRRLIRLGAHCPDVRIYLDFSAARILITDAARPARGRAQNAPRRPSTVQSLRIARQSASSSAPPTARSPTCAWSSACARRRRRRQPPRRRRAWK